MCAETDAYNLFQIISGTFLMENNNNNSSNGVTDPYASEEESPFKDPASFFEIQEDSSHSTHTINVEDLLLQRLITKDSGLGNNGTLDDDDSESSIGPPPSTTTSSPNNNKIGGDIDSVFQEAPRVGVNENANENVGEKGTSRSADTKTSTTPHTHHADDEQRPRPLNQHQRERKPREHQEKSRHSADRTAQFGSYSTPSASAPISVSCPASASASAPNHSKSNSNSGFYKYQVLPAFTGSAIASGHGHGHIASLPSAVPALARVSAANASPSPNQAPDTAPGVAVSATALPTASPNNSYNNNITDPKSTQRRCPYCNCSCGGQHSSSSSNNNNDSNINRGTRSCSGPPDNWTSLLSSNQYEINTSVATPKESTTPGEGNRMTISSPVRIRKRKITGSPAFFDMHDWTMVAGEGDSTSSTRAQQNQSHHERSPNHPRPIHSSHIDCSQSQTQPHNQRGSFPSNNEGILNVVEPDDRHLVGYSRNVPILGSSSVGSTNSHIQSAPNRSNDNNSTMPLGHSHSRTGPFSPNDRKGTINKLYNAPYWPTNSPSQPTRMQQQRPPENYYNLSPQCHTDRSRAPAEDYYTHSPQYQNRGRHGCGGVGSDYDPAAEGRGYFLSSGMNYSNNDAFQSASVPPPTLLPPKKGSYSLPYNDPVLRPEVKQSRHRGPRMRRRRVLMNAGPPESYFPSITNDDDDRNGTDQDKEATDKPNLSETACTSMEDSANESKKKSMTEPVIEDCKAAASSTICNKNNNIGTKDNTDDKNKDKSQSKEETKSDLDAVSTSMKTTSMNSSSNDNDKTTAATQGGNNDDKDVASPKPVSRQTVPATIVMSSPKPTKASMTPPTTASSSPRPCTTSMPTRVYVDKINESDVLFGRGGKINHHPGNQKYLDRVAYVQPLHHRSCKNQKTQISHEIVQWVYSKGGRFLEKDNSNGKYFIVEHERARRKAAQALTEFNRRN